MNGLWGGREWFVVLSRGVQSDMVATRKVGASTMETALRTPPPVVLTRNSQEGFEVSPRY